MLGSAANKKKKEINSDTFYITWMNLEYIMVSEISHKKKVLILYDSMTLSRTNIKKDVLFIIGEWNAKVGSQEMPGVTGKFDFGVQNEAGQRLTEFCQENTLVIANTLF